MTEDSQIRDSAGAIINPAKEEKQFQHSGYWHNRITSSGVIKAEESGKTVIITDVIYTHTANATATFRYGGAAGAVAFQARVLANSTVVISMRQGIEGNAYDGSNAGDMYIGLSAGTIACTGYMREV